MSGTRRRPRLHPRQTRSLPDEAVLIYEKMLLCPRADDEWWRLHNELCDLLQTPPDIWPLLPKPGEAPWTEFQLELKLRLEAALEEREVMEATRLS
jgi:hypothetical protein